MRISPVIWIALILFSACRQRPAVKDLRLFDGWIGDWVQPGDSLPYYEHWEKVSDSLYRGFGIVSNAGDTQFYEAIELKRSGMDIYYVVRMPGQADAAAVSFKYTGDSSGMAIFTNPEHDFPQRIGYGQPAMDSLVAWVDGLVDGEYQRSDFPMIRKK